jgi:hypothetical protein
VSRKSRKPDGGKQPPQHHEHEKAKEMSNISGNVHVTGEIETHIPPKLAKEREAAEVKKDSRDSKRLILEYATVGLIAIYAFVTILMYCANKKAADAAKSAANTASDTLKFQVASERPWIGPTKAGPTYSLSDPAKKTNGFKIELLNAGRSPATNVAINLKWFIGPPLPEQGDPRNLPRSDDCDKGPLLQGHTFLIPNIPLDHIEDFPPYVLASREEIYANRKGLYLVGCIDYFGPSGQERYRTNISEKLMSGKGKVPDMLWLTDTGNDAY